MTTQQHRIGLAISGGGFRAAAFGLGAMRALHDLDLLKSVRVVSGISGGSILAALWAYGPRDFNDFDLTVRKLLRRGLQAELARRAFAPKAMSRSLVATVRGVATGRRAFSRVEALVAALATRGLNVPMSAVTHPDLDVVISATDLANGNAVRFGSRVSAISPRGRILEEVPVADAVAASAAFPLLLPPLVRTYEFERPDGARDTATLAMTDGGVYDNLGITPLLPGRSPQYTQHVYDLDALFVVDSGRGRFERRPAAFWLNRTRQTFEISHARVQDSGRARIYDHAAELPGGIVHVYLGSNDQRLPHIADLVRRDSISNYPTDFAAMPISSLDALSVRAEQISRTLATRHFSGH